MRAAEDPTMVSGFTNTTHPNQSRWTHTHTGKLMERLLFFRTLSLKFTPLLMEYAEKRLQELAGSATTQSRVSLKYSAWLMIRIH